MPEQAASARVLVVDDDAGVRSRLRALLETAGARVSEAVHGHAALHQARAAAFDLAIIDLIMPQKDGLETIRELRLARLVPHIIAISGAAQYLNMARLLGAEAVFPKPLNEAELISSVRRLLGI